MRGYGADDAVQRANAKIAPDGRIIADALYGLRSVVVRVELDDGNGCSCLSANFKGCTHLGQCDFDGGFQDGW